ncbi:winged helix DNA-binding domain-containing protein [Solirubrobacter ginsenosidimutans]|uniref:Winged helix DNA-binding domain-containing protein n=1 Tax=Solirubrobacter ginsenosidimutans TaxID=490573 RepID=A0A9X3S0C3_9ACTN|nr:winged helix DNA-binding domain-containing protein [Solirubrobacter ginsenosidimutans]MDA0161895.1 winged helix DNA-binding domain-containing protein [Solirubrobacter ginsenosidimutans]
MPPTLKARELNRALLARQGLLERTERSIPEMLDAMGTLQAQYAPSMYVGLWSRLAGFERDSLTRALQEREVVQATLMRVTIHLCSRADYWPLTLPVRAARRTWWSRATKGPSDVEMEAAAETLRAALREGPLRKKAIDELLGKPVAHGIGLWVDMVRVPPSGTWERRRADLYGLAEEWVPRPPIDPEAALDHLVTRYLTGFGPAAKAEIANWAGMTAKDVEPALGRLELRRFAAEDGTELLDLPDLPLPDADTSAPVRFLGTWDACLLVHARRALILPEAHRPRIFNTKMPQSVGTFLVDGAVAGAWRPDGTIEPFADLSAKHRKQVEAEAARLAAFSA